jgi:hypothetical protein
MPRSLRLCGWTTRRRRRSRRASNRRLIENSARRASSSTKMDAIVSAREGARRGVLDHAQPVAAFIIAERSPAPLRKNSGGAAR